jgi:tetratricopeptide (TPR) repeat protein
MQELSHGLASPGLPLEERARQAAELFQNAYRLQALGLADEAAEMFQRSIEAKPTAEAHTFLGRTYRIQGKLQEAIAECKAAIEIDPEFGNPYNDLGAYLVDQGETSEAIPWLERALGCAHYDTPQYAWLNLGRAYEARDELSLARACLRQAVKLAPDYALALEAIRRVQELIQTRNLAILG